MGTKYARMETEGQPNGGWSVDVTTMTSRQPTLEALSGVFLTPYRKPASLSPSH
ncbi:hypothetical protein L914_20433 [Phytophthora nicotianae]|uniref:Uncharacterized protein n=1 Tax=Phytophthora nicotianae TaxID=4792 RepID=W2M6U1_PHYNI|nr:hypothetical protein L914_20433 [Phytophthora nicotianae]